MGVKGLLSTVQGWSGGFALKLTLGDQGHGAEASAGATAGVIEAAAAASSASVDAAATTADAGAGAGTESDATTVGPATGDSAAAPPPSTATPPPPPVPRPTTRLVVDAQAFALHLYLQRWRLPWELGGDYAAFHVRIVALVRALRAAHVELTCILDGLDEPAKAATAASRHAARVVAAEAAEIELATGTHVVKRRSSHGETSAAAMATATAAAGAATGDSASGAPARTAPSHWVEMMARHAPGAARSSGAPPLSAMFRYCDLEEWAPFHEAAADTADRCSPVAPVLLREALVQALQSEGVTVVRSSREADADIATYCTRAGCAGVVSNDTDFLVLRCPGLVQCESLRVDASGSVTAHLLSRSKMCDVLRVSPEHLPTLACLAGNDYMDETEWCVQRLSAALPRPASGKHRSVAKKGRQAIVGAVAQYIRFVYKGDDTVLMRHLFPAAAPNSGRSGGGGGGGKSKNRRRANARARLRGGDGADHVSKQSRKAVSFVQELDQARAQYAQRRHMSFAAALPATDPAVAESRGDSAAPAAAAASAAAACGGAASAGGATAAAAASSGAGDGVPIGSASAGDEALERAESELPVEFHRCQSSLEAAWVTVTGEFKSRHALERTPDTGTTVHDRPGIVSLRHAAYATILRGARDTDDCVSEMVRVSRDSGLRGSSASASGSGEGGSAVVWESVSAVRTVTRVECDASRVRCPLAEVVAALATGTRGSGGGSDCGGDGGGADTAESAAADAASASVVWEVACAIARARGIEGDDVAAAAVSVLPALGAVLSVFDSQHWSAALGTCVALAGYTGTDNDLTQAHLACACAVAISSELLSCPPDAEASSTLARMLATPRGSGDSALVLDVATAQAAAQVAALHVHMCSDAMGAALTLPCAAVFDGSMTLAALQALRAGVGVGGTSTNVDGRTLTPAGTRAARSQKRLRAVLDASGAKRDDDLRVATALRFIRVVLGSV